jgi:hypothetical protein
MKKKNGENGISKKKKETQIVSKRFQKCKNLKI